MLVAPNQRRGSSSGNWPTWCSSATITPAMLSRAQEARVQEILGNGPPGTLPVYCLEHLATTAQIPPAHLADLAAFVRNLRAHGACLPPFAGTCTPAGHPPPRLLIPVR